MGRPKGRKSLPNNATEKICSGCGVLKSFSEFCKNKSTKFGIGCHCKQCDAKKHKAWRKDNLDVIRSRNLKVSFGITIDDYDVLLSKQNEVCAICGNKETRKNMYGIRRLAVDHNHTTGKIRGLLCSTCNQGLGMFYTDENGIDLLLKSVEYMRNTDG